MIRGFASESRIHRRYIKEEEEEEEEERFFRCEDEQDVQEDAWAHGARGRGHR